MVRNGVGSRAQASQPGPNAEDVPTVGPHARPTLRTQCSQCVSAHSVLCTSVGISEVRAAKRGAGSFSRNHHGGRDVCASRENKHRDGASCFGAKAVFGIVGDRQAPGLSSTARDELGEFRDGARREGHDLRVMSVLLRALRADQKFNTDTSPGPLSPCSAFLLSPTIPLSHSFLIVLPQ